jgi:hypothetical protein
MARIEVGDQVTFRAGSKLLQEFKLPQDSIGSVATKLVDPHSGRVWVDVHFEPGRVVILAADPAEFEPVTEHRD